MARPSDYSDETVSVICERIANGESLRSICRDEAMPAQSSVFKWLTLHREFAEQYARAREAQADTLADEMLDIADDASNDWMAVHKGENVGWQENGEAIGRSRLRLDARKWIASKLKPKKYGDASAVALTGADGGPIALVQWPLPQTALDQ